MVLVPIPPQRRSSPMKRQEVTKPTPNSVKVRNVKGNVDTTFNMQPGRCWVAITRTEADGVRRRYGMWITADAIAEVADLLQR